MFKSFFCYGVRLRTKSIITFRIVCFSFVKYGSLGLAISLKTRSRLSHLIKRESLMFSLRQYCLGFLIFTTKDSEFHFLPTFTSNLFF